MAPEDQALYRAIDDLKALTTAQFETLHEQISKLHQIDTEIDQLQIDATALHATARQHEHRITRLEGEKEHRVDYSRDERRHKQQIKAMVFGAITAAIIGGLFTFAITHL